MVVETLTHYQFSFNIIAKNLMSFGMTILTKGNEII